MKIGIISDIHSNFFALKKAIEYLLENESIDKLICAGDFVGYGPQPKECIKYFSKLQIDKYAVLGNHDLGVRYYFSRKNKNEDIKPRKDDKDFLKNDFRFNKRAEMMLKNNSNQINKTHYDFLNSLKHREKIKLEINDITKNIYLVHGSPAQKRNHRIGVYLMGIESFNKIVQVFDREKESKLADLIIVGHTHRRFVTAIDKNKKTKIINWSLLKAKIGGKNNIEFPVEFKLDHKINQNYQMVVNPGSVGQSRDGTGNISFTTVEFQDKCDTVKFFDLDYDRNGFYALMDEYPKEIRGADFWQRIF